MPRLSRDGSEWSLNGAAGPGAAAATLSPWFMGVPGTAVGPPWGVDATESLPLTAVKRDGLCSVRGSVPESWLLITGAVATAVMIEKRGRVFPTSNDPRGREGARTKRNRKKK